MPDLEPDAPADEAPSFEHKLDRLTNIVSQLERADGGLNLDQSLALFEEGVRLSESAADELDAAERRVEQLLPDGSTTPLEAGGP